MKRAIALILSLIMALSLVACGTPPPRITPTLPIVKKTMTPIPLP